MTDSNPGGWPDKPGVPANPERDGDHIIRTSVGVRVVTFWRATAQSFIGVDGSPYKAGSRCTYLGPCHTPAEVAAQVEAARREGAGLWLTMHSAPRDGSPILMARENGFAERVCWRDTAGITPGWYWTDCRPREASWFVSPENEHAWRWRPLPQPWSRARGDA
jgi:hypothetical protein